MGVDLKTKTVVYGYANENNIINVLFPPIKWFWSFPPSITSITNNPKVEVPLRKPKKQTENQWTFVISYTIIPFPLSFYFARTFYYVRPNISKFEILNFPTPIYFLHLNVKRQFCTVHVVEQLFIGYKQQENNDILKWLTKIDLWILWIIKNTSKIFRSFSALLHGTFLK